MIINCVECGESVSDKAKSCPTCGNPIKTNPLSDVIEVGRYLVYIPFRFYQEVLEIPWDQPMLGEELNKKLYLQPIEFFRVLFGIIKISFINLILTGLISSQLNTDSWMSLPIYLTKHQKTLNFPLFWDMYIYTLLVTHVYFAIILFFYFKKYKLL